jgi:uncharacterized cupin superfamily protein
MSDPNVHEPAWDADYRDTPVKSRVARVGATAGARQLGASVFELAPGGAVAPYHTHYGNEEMLIVLSGRPLLRTPEATRTSRSHGCCSSPPCSSPRSPST